MENSNIAYTYFSIKFYYIMCFSFKVETFLDTKVVLSLA